MPKFSLSGLVRVAIELALLACLLTDAAGWIEIPALTQLERWVYDARVRLFLPRMRDPRIVIVDVDERSLKAEGYWPWGRDKLALMIHQLFAHYGVRVVAFDTAFPETDPNAGLPALEAAARGELRDDAAFQAFFERMRPSLDHDRLFAEEIGKHPVVLGFLVSAQGEQSAVLPPPAFAASALADAQYSYFSAPGYSGNIAPLQAAATAAGHLYAALDPDGVTRSVPMFMQVGDDFFESMSLAVLRVYLGNAPIKLERTIVVSGGRNVGWMRSVNIGDAVRIPLDERMAALIPFRSQGSYRYVSATDVIRGTLRADELKDRIVLVGTSARGLVDVRATPIREDVPGVEIHASLISGALDNAVKSRPTETIAIAMLTILLVGIPFAVFLRRLSALAATLAVAGVLAVLLGVNAWAWQARNLVLPLAGPLVMLAGLYFLDVVWGYFAETRHRRLLTDLFGTYVPKEIVAEMAEHPDEYSMHGQSLEMSVLFADIRDFTSIAETRTPQDLKDLINTFFTRMTVCIEDKRGIVDKYIGDAIMAFWGSPYPQSDHALRACHCALAMLRTLDKLNIKWQSEGRKEISIGIGLNTGPVNVGNMGSAKRLAWTVMGDNVNLASRLEGMTKQYRTRIVISEGTYKEVAEHFVCRELDRIRVKGKHQPVVVYELMDLVAARPKYEALIIRFESAMEAYHAQNWRDAAGRFGELLASFPEDGPTQIFLQRALEFMENAPETDWDGVYVMKSK
jgi:adenylate cyclase